MTDIIRLINKKLKNIYLRIEQKRTFQSIQHRFEAHIKIIHFIWIRACRSTEYAACERLSREIQLQIVSRNQQPRLSNEYSKVSSTIRFSLKQFHTNLEQLNSTISQAARLGSM